jgi:hypothetical protein
MLHLPKNSDGLNDKRRTPNSHPCGCLQSRVFANFPYRVECPGRQFFAACSTVRLAG